MVTLLSITIFIQDNEDVNYTFEQNSPSALGIEAKSNCNALGSNLDEVENPKIERIYKLMMVGEKTTGKHALINSSFQDTSNVDEVLENSKYFYELNIFQILCF